MALAWSRGECVLADEVLARFPGLGDEETVRLIYEEVSLRRESGEDVATTEVVNRYPRYKDELEILLGCDRMLRPFSRVALFPSAPGELGLFRLLAELGRGASGTTYLATEAALGGRLVVLKVIRDDEQEHLSLARLQHTYIIPLFLEQTFPDRGLRALCMPYLRGTTLARVLDLVARIPPRARQGHHIVEALDRAKASMGADGRDADDSANCGSGVPAARTGRTGIRPGRAENADGMPAPQWSGGQTDPRAGSKPASDGPYRRYLERALYVEAVCWIVACLAEGLQSAHAHGLVHLDVKPSNVLIAGDGLPMQLDFHLARRPVGAGEQIVDRLGGTPGWIAPEHRAAMEAVSRGETISQPVDERADIFALGLLLREALAGPRDSTSAAPPGGRKGAGAWRRQNPEISVGLGDVVEKCLAARSRDRYRSAAALADDLRRHLNHLPLEGVAIGVSLKCGGSGGGGDWTPCRAGRPAWRSRRRWGLCSARRRSSIATASISSRWPLTTVRGCGLLVNLPKLSMCSRRLANRPVCFRAPDTCGARLTNSSRWRGVRKKRRRFMTWRSVCVFTMA